MNLSYFSLVVFSLPALLFSNPTGQKTVYGGANFYKTKKTLTVSPVKDKTIIEWQDFSIEEGESTYIQQITNTHSMLNRVVGNDVSRIFGKLESNGKVFLINQNGVMIGPNGIVKTNGFIASALAVATDEFRFKRELTFKGDGTGEVVNQGKILGLSGNVCLIARKVSDEGEIDTTGMVRIGAGTEVFLQEGRGQEFIIRVVEKGSEEKAIETVRNELISNGGNSASLAINQEGISHTINVVERDGRIFLETE